MPLPLVTSVSFNNVTLDQTTDQAEWIFQVVADNTSSSVIITRLGYRTGATLTGAQPTYKISLQGVDTATGFPDGTIKGGGSPASATFTPAGTNTWNWINLANSYTAARGELLAIVIAYDSGTIGASNKTQFTTNTGGNTLNFPYAIHNDAGTRTKQGSTVAMFGYGSASKAFGAPLGTNTAFITSYNAASTPDEYALRFNLDAAFCTSYKVVGFQALLQNAATGLSCAFKLYDGTTVLQDVTRTTDSVAAVLSSSKLITVHFDEATLSTLLAGSEYRIGIQPVDASGNFGITRLEVAAAADLEAYPGGTSWYSSTRSDAGAWSDQTTIRPVMSLIVQDWTAPTAAFGPRPMMVAGQMMPVY